jgi:hypothetical protein
VHGVSSTEGSPTDFVDDEYVVYKTAQQHMSYLVEFHEENDKKQPAPRRSASRQAAPLQASLIVPVEDYDVITAPTSIDKKPAEDKGDEQDQQAGLMSKGWCSNSRLP